MSLPVKRLLALDVFRGLTVCFMIIVNTAGNGSTTFSPLLHAKWHGFTPTDLVFPSFLFAIGNALAFVSLKWDALGTGQVIWKIFKRSLIIFLIGFIMYWFPFVRMVDGHYVLAPLSETRVLGVLQRIGLAYFIAALLIYFLKPRGALVMAIVFLISYWFLLMNFGDPSDPFNMLTDAGSRLDLWLLGEKHMYHGEGLAFEPEGWLSTLPSVANVIGGFLVGRLIRERGRSFEGLSVLLLWGCALVAIAYFWDTVLPINKKLWTSSFAVYTIGLDCLILGAIVYIVDLRQKAGWTYFFEVFGRNPLFIYLVSEVGAILLWFFETSDGTSYYRWIYLNIFSKVGAYLGSLLFAITFMLICWLVGYVMDKRKLYVRV